MRKEYKSNYSVSFLLITAILFFIPFQMVYAQDTSIKSYSFNLEIEKREKDRTPISKKDTLQINFDYGYINDIVTIKGDNKTFQSDTLNADNLFGFGGRMKIAKNDLRRPIEIYFNGIFIKKIKVNRKFSSVHLEFRREHREFTWRYLRYKFVYL